MSSRATVPPTPEDTANRKLKRIRDDIRMGRILARMSQQSLADEIGRTQRYVSGLESGQIRPKVDEVLIIAAILEPVLGRNILEDLGDD